MTRALMPSSAPKTASGWVHVACAVWSPALALQDGSISLAVGLHRDGSITDVVTAIDED